MAPTKKDEAELRNGQRVALVTGAGSGIGRAAALALQAAGFAVMLTGRRGEMLDATAQMAVPGGGKVEACAADVTDPDAVANLFSRTKDRFGRLDVLFNNAGSNAPGIALDEMSLEQWQSVMSVNATGAFLCAQAAIRQMLAQEPKGGRIINNGSISAHSPRPHSAPYTASKHAITGLTKSIALDYRQHNIACGQIDIGNAATEMTGRMAVGVAQANGSVLPEPTMDVRHVAEAVVYMATLPLDVNVQFITVMATQMPFIGRG